MIPILFLAAPVQPVVVQQAPQAIVVYQPAPRPFANVFAPRPQVYVIQGSCAGGSCPK